MTKSELIAIIAGKIDLKKVTVQAVIDAFLQEITDKLKEGETVNLIGFGTFKISHRSERLGVNPQKPEEKITIPAMNLPSFKAGKALKDAVR
jgi:DNA-binding protein HU-alpha